MHVCIVQVKSVVTYGKHWVKQQARMTSTSNQEVFRANVEGRLVIDMLRVILVSFNLSTFTLAECTQVRHFVLAAVLIHRKSLFPGILSSVLHCRNMARASCK